MQRWILEADVSWNRIDVPLALSQPDLLDQIRESALIESYFPIYTTRLMREIWDDIDATSVFSIQLYESVQALLCPQPLSGRGRLQADSGSGADRYSAPDARAGDRRRRR